MPSLQHRTCILRSGHDNATPRIMLGVDDIAVTLLSRPKPVYGAGEEAYRQLIWSYILDNLSVDNGGKISMSWQRIRQMPHGSIS